MKRFASLIAAAGAVSALSAFVLVGGASASSSLPTLNVALSGAKGVSVSGSTVAGAVNVVTTFTGKLPRGSEGAEVGIVRLYNGATIQQAATAVQSHHGDINYLAPYGTLFFAAAAPSQTQTVFLVPGNYVALNLTGNGNPGFAPFTVSQSSSSAVLPAASATQTAIDFSFRGPTVLHDGTVVRAQNGGNEAHMIILIGARNRAAAGKLLTLLRHGASQKKAAPYLNGQFVGLLGIGSPGALQQMVLQAKPGYYVEACFMDTQDGRQHAQLGMARLVRVVK